MKINLLPEEYRPQPSVNIYRLLFMLISSASLFIVALLILQQWLIFTNVSDEVKQVKEQIIVYGKSYENIKHIEVMQMNLKKQEKEIEDLRKSCLPVDEIYKETASLLPDKLWLKLFEISDKQQISILGQSTQMNAIGSFLFNIEKSPRFGGIVLDNISDVTSKEKGSLYDFRLTFNIEKAGVTNER